MPRSSSCWLPSSLWYNADFRRDAYTDTWHSVATRFAADLRQVAKQHFVADVRKLLAPPRVKHARLASLGFTNVIASMAFRPRWSRHQWVEVSTAVLAMEGKGMRHEVLPIDWSIHSSIHLTSIY